MLSWRGSNVFMKQRRAVFLDRDGVLNRAIVRNGRPYPPANLAELELTAGARDACAVLRRAGYLLVIVTNQPDIARGAVTHESVADMNLWLASELGLDHAKVCPHDDADRCACRKPKPGLLLQYAAEWNIDLDASFMIGDRWRDVEAGARAGCRTVFIDYSYDEKRPSCPDYTARSLPDAVQWITEIAERHPNYEHESEHGILENTIRSER
jgi:D-glycero-D-manno-heptose 1,7-bisphosphate phosphatase